MSQSKLSSITCLCDLLAVGLKQTETHKVVENHRALPTNTLKYYIIVIKKQIYVQTKENIRKDPIQTHKQENDRAPTETNQNPGNAVLQPITNHHKHITA